MIKLIATDMDGTLLNSKGELPEGFFDTLDELIDRGVIFVAASGRQYYTLADNFGKAKDKMLFVAENGSFVVHNGKELFSKILPKETIMEILEAVNKIPNCFPVVCGKKYGYYKDTNPRFLKELQKYYYNRKQVENFEDIEDDFLKVAIFDLEGSSENSYKKIDKKWKEELQVTVSGQDWVDIFRKDIDKGVAINYLQQKFNITHEETMVFGDYFNDIQMLQNAYHSYVMVNAPEELKKYGRFMARSNDDNGVIEVIEREVLKKDA
ncbi:HAD family hydrolase [Clostridium sp. YIM B02505]|uniref:HAD family hydrolase n=1 Tax=Clostridium yunnanense TaxID=2800325 RepID=A0ABS1EM77_9CLOT|nr:Cof-type HAD-IIB family hydrolase [Clostridium yunnanense]MBK1810430.1 HAD family hydrolase [Clostridium yunnanense]